MLSTILSYSLAFENCPYELKVYCVYVTIVYVAKCARTERLSNRLRILSETKDISTCREGKIWTIATIPTKLELFKWCPDMSFWFNNETSFPIVRYKNSLKKIPNLDQNIPEYEFIIRNAQGLTKWAPNRPILESWDKNGIRSGQLFVQNDF